MTTFINLKTRVAVNIGYVDSTGAILTGREITETDIGNWINNRYQDELVASLATAYPEDYIQTGFMNFYKASSTLSSITTTTVVVDDAIFTTGMAGIANAGDRLYNSDMGDYTKIKTYTNTTTVVTEDDKSDTWTATDPIYVLGHEFALAGDATDNMFIRQVSVLYDSDNEYYRTCRYMDKALALREGSEVYHENDPIWYTTTLKVSSTPTTAIGVLPEPDVATANGIKLEYVQLPSALSEDADVPKLPLGHHVLLEYGATADALRRRHEYEKADIWEGKYQLGKAELLADYPLTRAGEPNRVRPDSNRLYKKWSRNYG